MAIIPLFENMTVKEIIKQKKRLRFDLHIQRNLVWTDDQKSLFIHSLLYGYPFPPVYAQYDGSSYLWILDGKQRLTTIINFISPDDPTDKFALTANTPDIDGIDITNHIYEALPEELQDRLLDAKFTVFQIRNMNEDERDDLFERLNSGTALSRQEISRVRGGMEVLEFLDRLKNIPFISEKVNITAKQKNRFVDEELVLQIIYLYKEREKIKGFSKKILEDFIINLRENPISKEDEDKFISIAEYLDKVFSDGRTEEEYKEREKNRKRILKKVHVPVLFVVAGKALESDVQPNDFYEWATSFLTIKDESDLDKKEYAESTSAGSAKPEKIRKRLSIMEKSFTEHFKTKQLV